MKTWIIILTIAWVVLMLVAKALENYIRNDEIESLKYRIRNGMTNLGIWYTIFYGLYKLTFWADIIFVIIYILNKL